ncbi:hypothetical protein ACSBR1_038051 [Camellia fascicularis]
MPYYLKICPSYLSIFPEDQQIICNRLIRLWTAEGFVNATDEKKIEEVAEGQLNELFNKSLVQEAQRGFNGKPYSFHIHDLMREIILSKAIEENIVTRAQGGRRKFAAYLLKAHQKI